MLHLLYTDRLVLYHNLRLKYMPKRYIHLKYNDMCMRSIIAIFDHYNNVNKKEIREK